MDDAEKRKTIALIELKRDQLSSAALALRELWGIGETLDLRNDPHPIETIFEGIEADKPNKAKNTTSKPTPQNPRRKTGAGKPVKEKSEPRSGSWTDERLEELWQKYNDGERPKALAEYFDCDAKEIYNRIHATKKARGAETRSKKKT